MLSIDLPLVCRSLGAFTWPGWSAPCTPQEVDLQVEFAAATEEQIGRMFASFYPESSRGEEFVAAVTATLDGRSTTTAVTPALVSSSFTS